MAKSRGNGQGSVTKIKDTKGKIKYQIRVTVGSEFDAEKEKFRYISKSLGVYKTKAEAEAVLAEYNSSPYDLTNKITTVGELYDYWSETYFEKVVPSAKRSVESAWAYCESIRNLKLKKLGSSHIRDVMENGTREVIRGSKKEVRHTSINTKLRIKSLFNLMLDEAVGLKLVTSNVARAFDVKDMRKEADYQKKKKESFSNEELEILWNNLDYRFMDMLLIGIYSGFRPSELCNIEIKNVDLENNIIVEGMKTEAGRDRVVPIHPLIKPLVEARFKQAKVEYLGKHPKSRNGVFNLIKELADCDAIEKGVILGIKANSDNLRGRLSFFEMQQGDLTYVTDSRGRRFVMLFTSKKKFELCPDIQGYVCFIKELFEALAVKEAVDGIAFNINSDGILLDKFVIRIVLEFINRVGE